MRATSLTTAAAILTGEDDGRVCADIPDTACRHRPRNLLTHVASLAATKTADGLSDPRLVLAWLITQVGAPAALVGLLVPVREAGALLPQLLTAGAIRALPRRKWAWAGASAVQGLAVLGIALAALLFHGATAGWTILALLAVLALARSVAAVSLRDVLAKTVGRSRRGAATGAAAGLAAVFVIAFALTLILELGPRAAIVIWALMLAGLLWLLAAALFATLAEERGATEGGATPLLVARANLGLLVADRPLRRFLVTRALLIAPALAPPYIVALASTTPGRGLEALGALVLASALAGLAGPCVWGRLAAVSSRRLLAVAALAAAISLGLAALADATALLFAPLVLPALVFGLMLADQGVRLGRTVHLIDIATPATRAGYTALLNAATGALLLAGGLFAVMAQALGLRAVVIALAVMAALAIPTALALDEGEGRGAQ